MIARLMGLRVIAPHELHRRLDDGSAIAVDVNARERWSHGHVPGARHLDPDAFEADALPVDRDATLVFDCSNPMCTKAPRAARRAQHMGYRNAVVMAAGISGWLGAGLPTESGEPTPA